MTVEERMANMRGRKRANWLDKDYDPRNWIAGYFGFRTLKDQDVFVDRDLMEEAAKLFYKSFAEPQIENKEINKNIEQFLSSRKDEDASKNFLLSLLPDDPTFATKLNELYIVPAAKAAPPEAPAAEGEAPAEAQASIVKKEQESIVNAKLKDLVNDCFKSQHPLDTTLKDIKENIDILKKYQADETNENKTVFRTDIIIKLLNGYKLEMEEAAKNQHDAESNKLKTLISKLSLTEEQGKKLQEELAKKQQEEKTAIQNMFDNETNAMFKHAQVESDRINFLAGVAQKSRTTYGIIDELYRNRSDADEAKRFRGISVKEVIEGGAHTITGRKIQYDLSTNGLSINIPNGFFQGVLYSANRHMNMRYDILSIAKASKAMGVPPIANITCKNPEHAEEVARQTYEALVDAGYELKDIKVHINGNLVSGIYANGKLTGDKLFTKDIERFKDIEQVAKNYNRNPVMVGSNSLRDLKQQIKDLRSQAQQDELVVKQQQQQQQQPPPNHNEPFDASSSIAQ